MLETRDFPLRSQTHVINRPQGGLGCLGLGRSFTVTTTFIHPPLQPEYHDETPHGPAVNPLRPAHVPESRSQLVEQRHRAELLQKAFWTTRGEVQRESYESSVVVNAGKQLFFRCVAVQKITAFTQLKFSEERVGDVRSEIGSAGEAPHRGVSLGGVGELDERPEGQFRRPHLGLFFRWSSALEVEAVHLDAYGEHRSMQRARF